MEPRDRTAAVAWAVFGILVGTSALAVLASLASWLLAVVVALGGVAAALLLSWAAQPAAGPGQRSAEPSHDEHREAA